VDASISRYATFCTPEQRKYVLVAAILASSLGFIDGSVMAIAVPAMRTSLDASLVKAQWISNAYLLPLAAFLLVGGAAGDRFGLRRVFMFGIAAFVAASVLCAIAPSVNMLIAARGFQGLAAAFMIPGSLAIISKAYPREERGRAIGIWSAASAITTAGGPIIGGFLLSFGNAELWRVIFAVNLPLGIVAIYFLAKKVPADSYVPSKRIDYLGGFLAVTFLGALAWALTGPEGEGGLPDVRHMLVYLAGAAIALGMFIVVERRAEDPVMPLRLFHVRTFAAANIVTFLLYFALGTILFFLPMAVIGGWQLPEAQAGFVFLPLTAFIAILSGPAGTMSDRFGPGPLLSIGCFIVGLSYAGLAFGMGYQNFWLHIIPMMALMGLGMGILVAPLSTAVMAAVSDRDQGAASGINNAVARVAGLVAVAAMGTFASAIYPQFGSAIETASPFLAEHAAGNNEAFQYIAIVAAVMCFLAALVAALDIRRSKAD
jgi:EmrB/QacA subfamily drug resistance transporter